MFSALNISASGLSAQRKKMDAIASNIANANTTKTENGEPYRRQVVVMESEEVPVFEKFLRKSRLKLERTHKAHFPFKQVARVFRNGYKGVEAKVVEDRSDFLRVYDPSHPDADEEGYVLKPNINVVSEMVEMINANRSYEANISSIEAAKQMARNALDI
ncbi:MAG: flagellar basal body rod protein FlgC [Calditrichaeota bacterium]|nr:MAG: flagellar basal body rod protein FlgC [Calditrichota bacterium]